MGKAARNKRARREEQAVANGVAWQVKLFFGEELNAVDEKEYMQDAVMKALEADDVERLNFLNSQCQEMGLSFLDMKFDIELMSSGEVVPVEQASIVEVAFWAEADKSLSWVIDLAFENTLRGELDVAECIANFLEMATINLDLKNNGSRLKKLVMAVGALKQIAEFMHKDGSLDILIGRMELAATPESLAIVKQARGFLLAQKELETLREVTSIEVRPKRKSRTNAL